LELQIIIKIYTWHESCIISNVNDKIKLYKFGG